MMTVDSLLARACDAEAKMLAAENDADRAKQRRMANIAFRKAMHMDGGTTDYAENILGD